jgi:serine/threonine-protein kinase HipA
MTKRGKARCALPKRKEDRSCGRRASSESHRSSNSPDFSPPPKDSRDNEPHTYLEIVDALRQHGAAAKDDMEALWHRVVFNVLISNSDDHLRNHGFLYTGPDGWRLSPAYDLNPVPVQIKPRILSTAISEEDNSASLQLAMDNAGYFDLDAAMARAISREVGRAVSTWRDEAARHDLTKREIDRMASAFEHNDLELARTPK